MQRLNYVFRILALLGLTAAPFFAFSFFLLPALAQSTATISGILTDPSDATVPGAAVILQDTATTTNVWKTATDSDGRFTFSVPAGRYRLTITHPSLLRLEEEFSVTAGEHRDLDRKLALEPLSENVVVSAEACPSIPNRPPIRWPSLHGKK